MAATSLRDRFIGYFEPLYLLVFGYTYFLTHVLETLLRSPLRLFDIQSLRRGAFSRQWLALNRPAPVTKAATTSQQPSPITKLLESARGVVLELGPGSGIQLSQWPAETASKNVEVVYGAEPVTELHDALRSATEKHSWASGGRYQILSCGAEPESLIPGLEQVGLLKGDNSIQEGVFDTIVSLRVLCSISTQQETLNMLYRLLKPGGRILVYEHVVNAWRTPSGSVIARVLQATYMALGWSFVWADCSLQRDTGKALEKAASPDGGWADVRLERLNDGTVIPYLIGSLQKKHGS